MKRAVLLLVLTFLGYGAATVYSAYLYRLWIDLGLDRSVGQTLSDVGLDAIDRVWGIAWLFLPEWVIAGAAGIGARLLLGKLSLWYAFAFCVGFTLVPQLEFLADSENWPFGLAACAAVILWSLMSFPIALIVCSFVFRRQPDTSSDHLQFTILRLLMFTCWIAVLGVLILRWRQIALPCFLLGSLSWLAYTTVHRRDPNTMAPRASQLAEP